MAARLREHCTTAIKLSKVVSVDFFIPSEQDMYMYSLARTN